MLTDWSSLLSQPKYSFVVDSIQHIKQVIQQYGGLPAVSLCFNGGKDCTVLLHLLAYMLKTDLNLPLSSITIVYFKVDHEFDELYQFNLDMMNLYGFALVEFDGSDMKQCLSQMLQQFPTLKVIFMGQRRTDPHGGNLSLVQQSDVQNGWPPVDRANTILDWSYNQVWDFLVDFQLPYCRLYELGFSSLGSLGTTIPNPWLLKLKTIFTPTIYNYAHNDSNDMNLYDLNHNTISTNDQHNQHNNQQQLQLVTNPKQLQLVMNPISNHIISNQTIHDINSPPNLTHDVSLHSNRDSINLHRDSIQNRDSLHNSVQLSREQSFHRELSLDSIPCVECMCHTHTHNTTTNNHHTHQHNYTNSNNNNNNNNQHISPSSIQIGPQSSHDDNQHQFQDSLSFLTHQLQSYLDTQATIQTQLINNTQPSPSSSNIRPLSSTIPPHLLKPLHDHAVTPTTPSTPTTQQATIPLTTSSLQPQQLSKHPSSLANHPEHQFHILNEQFIPPSQQINNNQSNILYDVRFELYTQPTTNPHTPIEQQSNQQLNQQPNQQPQSLLNLNTNTNDNNNNILNFSRLYHQNQSKPSFINGIPYNSNSPTGVIMIRLQCPQYQTLPQNSSHPNPIECYQINNNHNTNHNNPEQIDHQQLIHNNQQLNINQQSNTNSNNNSTPDISRQSFTNNYSTTNSIPDLYRQSSTNINLLPTTINNNLPTTFDSVQNNIATSPTHFTRSLQPTTNNNNINNNINNNSTNTSTISIHSHQLNSDTTLHHTHHNDSNNTSIHYDLIMINLAFWPYLPAYILSNSELERDGRIKPLPSTHLKQRSSQSTNSTSTTNHQHTVSNSTIMTNPLQQKASLSHANPLLSSPQHQQQHQQQHHCKTCQIKKSQQSRLDNNSNNMMNSTDVSGTNTSKSTPISNNSNVNMNQSTTAHTQPFLHSKL